MIHKRLETILLTLAIAACVGCRREEIRVYTAPKERPRAAVAAHDPHGPHDGHNHGADEAPARPRPEITWKLPAGWKQTAPGRMSVASFSITNGAGKEAQVAITPMPMLAGREPDLVNMFREQVGLKALSPEETTKELRDVQVGGDAGKVFEVVGQAEGAEEPPRIITAMAHRSDSTWFYKLSGDQSVVEAQRGAFLDFLKSISIKETAPSEMESIPAAKKWQVPGDWKEVPAGQMQVARFAVPEKNGAKAEVFVSVFPNDTGGTLPNVNRWRRQLKLNDVSEGELAQITKPVDGLPGAIVTDLSNSANGQQLIGAIVPRGGQFWFYKLIGGAEAVAPQLENLIRFIQTPP